MRQYESYVNSGLEWISTIPSCWSTMPLKRYGRFNKGLTFTKADLVEDGNPVVSYGQVHSKINNGTHLSNELIRYVPDKFVSNANNSVVRKGDFIFADTSEDLDGAGNVAYNDKDTVIYGGYHTVLFQTKNDDNRYLAYLFSTDCWRSQVRSRVSGIKVFSITQSILSMTSIILPPEIEQKKMADYLDEKIAQIDSIIRTREKKIELLEKLKASIITNAVTKGVKKNVDVKDSGDEWIGEIPKSWEMKKLKFISTFNDEVIPDNFGEDNRIEYVEISDVNVSHGIINTTEYKFKEAPSRARRITRKGDVILSTVRTYLKAIAKIDWDGLIVSTGFAVIRPQIDPAFLYYALISDIFINKVVSQSVGVSYPAINSFQISNIKIPVPPIQEQKLIVDYVENRSLCITNSVTKAYGEIELLKEYRASLITEVVTGKRKII